MYDGLPERRALDLGRAPEFSRWRIRLFRSQNASSFCTAGAEFPYLPFRYRPYTAEACSIFQSYRRS